MKTVKDYNLSLS